jgi:hypothetical protein
VSQVIGHHDDFHIDHRSLRDTIFKASAKHRVETSMLRSKTAYRVVALCNGKARRGRQLEKCH